MTASLASATMRGCSGRGVTANPTMCIRARCMHAGKQAWLFSSTINVSGSLDKHESVRAFGHGHCAPVLPITAEADDTSACCAMFARSAQTRTVRSLLLAGYLRSTLAVHALLASTKERTRFDSKMVQATVLPCKSLLTTYYSLKSYRRWLTGKRVPSPEVLLISTNSTSSWVYSRVV